MSLFFSLPRLLSSSICSVYLSLCLNVSSAPSLLCIPNTPEEPAVFFLFCFFPHIYSIFHASIGSSPHSCFSLNVSKFNFPLVSPSSITFYPVFILSSSLSLLCIQPVCYRSDVIHSFTHPLFIFITYVLIYILHTYGIYISLLIHPGLL